MNRGRLIIVLGLIAAVGLTVGWLWLARHPRQQDATEATTSALATTQATAAAEAGMTHQPPVESQGLNLPPGLNPRIWKQMAHVRSGFAKMNGPIAFYGRIIDQRNDPVIGARIHLTLSRYSERLLDTLDADKMMMEQKISTVADASGWLSITGKFGSTLRIEDIEGEGYLWRNPGFGSFDYGTNRSGVPRPYADPSKGIILHTWKKGVTDPVIEIHQRIRLVENQIEYPLNIFSTIRSEGIGPVDLLLKIPLAAPDDPTRPLDRWITLEAPEGGILETKDVYPYAAPESGYEKAWRKLFQPGGPRPDSEGWSRNYYLKARKGHVYAGLVVKFAQGMDGFEIIGFINPHGSRNLEPDPAKQITDPDEIRKLDNELGDTKQTP